MSDTQMTQQVQVDSRKAFDEWIQKLKADGKSDQEIGQLLAGVSKFSASAIYLAIMSSLTEDDVKLLEGIADDDEAKRKMEELFKLRTGLTVAEMAKRVQEGFAKGYQVAGTSK